MEAKRQRKNQDEADGHYEKSNMRKEEEEGEGSGDDDKDEDDGVAEDVRRRASGLLESMLTK